MRVMPDRYLQLDFQRRAPELATIAPTSGQSEPRASRRSAHFGNRDRLGSAFSSERRDLVPLASDAAIPLPRRRVNDAGFNVGTKHLPSLVPPVHPSRRQPQPTTFSTNRRHPPTSAIDAKPEHTGERPLPGRPAAFHGGTLLLTEPRRRVKRTDRAGPESAPCKARPPALDLNGHPCRKRRPRRTGVRGGFFFRRLPRPTSGTPRERTYLRNEPGCLSLRGIRPFLFDPEWPHLTG
jgi:hypothetical protein